MNQNSSKDNNRQEENKLPSAGSYSLVEGHLPNENEVKFTIGHYKILESIGKGGMGEVFLAYDTNCGRRIALKRIRPDLLDYKQINDRFLKEAHVTSQLTHPSIIPIYSIHRSKDEIYYTMPYVQGETLKEVFRQTRKQEKSGENPHHIGSSIPALIRIFLTVCQAIAYSHSKKVLHRDLKPENIIIGPYGEVMILDWGLAKLYREHEESNDVLPSSTKKMDLSGLTRIGKVVGTISYMAPERAKGLHSTFQTDVYSLGVILYQMLTLRFPFRRGTLEEFRKKVDHEVLKNPSEVAPYRDVPRMLASIATKCLEPDPNARYQNVQDLIHDLENYMEGRGDWFKIAELDPQKKEDWEFQEHVYLPEHIAIARSTSTDISEWMNLMISKASLSENIRLEATITLGKNNKGLGFLLSIPEAAERRHLNDGYCLWIGNDTNKTTKLLRSTVEVVHAPEIALKRGHNYHVRIDKIDQNIYFSINNKRQFSYISYLPLLGTHVGILSQDDDYQIEDFTISVGGQSVIVKCLAVPDAFLAHKDFTAALTEYRRIGYSFTGRAEGREAMFRAGITLLEQAKNCSDKQQREKLYDKALEEFEKLHQTPGAPLEYLGKALVYQTIGEYDEEIKCYELACRRYVKHPLINVLHEQIIYRMHESSRYHRHATYQFILLAVRLLPKMTKGANSQRLFHNLMRQWEKLPFIEALEEGASKQEQYAQFAIQLAFWLAKTPILVELIHHLKEKENPSSLLIGNGIFCLLKLQADKEVSILCTELKQTASCKSLVDSVQAALSTTFEKSKSERALIHIIEKLISLENYQQALTLCNQLTDSIQKDSLIITALLREKKWQEAGGVLNTYSVEELSDEHSPLFSLYGIWL